MRIKAISLVIILAVTSCSKDDSPNPGTFAGEWIGNKKEQTGCKNEANNGIESLSCTNSFCYKLTLMGDGNYTYQTGGQTQSGKWSVSGSVLSLCVTDDESGKTTCTNYGTALSADALVIDNKDNNTECTIRVNMTKSTSGQGS